MRRFAALCVAVVLLVAARAEPVQSQEVVLALVGPMTGESSEYGLAARRAVELFANEVSEAGGLNIAGSKRPLRIEVANDKADPERAASEASRLSAEENLVAVIGHFNSPCCLAANPVYAREGVVQLSYGCTDPAVTTDNPWTFRNVFDDISVGTAAALYAKEVLEIERVAVVFDSTSGEGLKNSFLAQAETMGLVVVGKEAYDSEEINFRGMLTKMRIRRPQALFLSGPYTQTGLIVYQARELGLRNVQFLGTGSLANLEFISIAGPASDGAIAVSPVLFDGDAAQTEAKAFEQKFVARYGVAPDWVAASAYDAARMVARTLEAIGTTDRKALRDALADKATPDVGFSGVTGLTFFDANGGSPKHVYFQQVRGGSWVPAATQPE